MKMKTATRLRVAILLMMAVGLTTAAGAQSGYEPINMHVGRGSAAVAVNNSGQAVGSFDPFGLFSGAFSWTPTDGRVSFTQGVGNEFQRAVAVNDSGQVVVSIAYEQPCCTGPRFTYQAFLWTPATEERVDLGTLGGSNSYALAINASGQVTGWSDTAAGPRHAFLWTAADGMLDLGTLGTASSVSEALAVNANGRVVGWSEIGGFHHAFSWTPADGMLDLGTLGGTNSEARAVNASGQVVGWSEVGGSSHAFSWTPTGGMIDLGTLGGMRSEAIAVSANGQVVGWSEIGIGDNAIHAFSWTPTGGMVDLGTLGGRDSEASAVNAAGQVVGRSQRQNGDVRAFSWTAAGGMVDLGTLSPEPYLPSLTTGYRSAATALNESGDIVGWSLIAPVIIDSGRIYATMWRREQRDVTPPTLLLPATIVVDGTSPAGAVVTYSVSATDDVDPNPVVVCTPPSGTVFPLRVTTVSCTATDAAGNSATGTFQVVVLDATQQLQETIGLIASYDLRRLGTSLSDKLQLASDSIAAGNLKWACGVLTGFLNQVRAQAGKALTVEQATELTTRATRIRNVIGC